jgi:hypothetical protein
MISRESTMRSSWLYLPPDPPWWLDSNCLNWQPIHHHPYLFASSFPFELELELKLLLAEDDAPADTLALPDTTNHTLFSSRYARITICQLSKSDLSIGIFGRLDEEALSLDE